MRYLDCPEGSFPWKIRQLLENNSTAIDPAVQTWHDLIEDSPPCLSREIQRAPVDGLTRLPPLSPEAAGVAGRQKWGLVLSSSARVSQVTHQTVVGVRYPKLVTFNGASWNFGKFVTRDPFRSQVINGADSHRSFCDLQSGNNSGLGKDNCMGCHAGSQGNCNGGPG